MNVLPPDPPTPHAALAPRRSRSPIAFLAGIALLGAAVFALASHRDQFTGALESARGAAWWLIVLALLLPLVNWGLMSLSFWILMRRQGPVTLAEMSCLIGAAWLLNYLPLRPGLLGRVAYHKAVNGIPIARSIGVTITSILCAGAAIGILLFLCAVFAAMRPALGIQLLIIGGVGAIGALATLAMHVARGPWWIAATIALRFIDLLVWAGRYAVVFAIVGHPITVAAAMALAVLCQIAMLVPLVGNGLGLREWAVGAVAGILPEDLVSSSGTLTTTIGLAADLANRAAELVTAVPVGLLCAHSLARRTSGRVVT